MRSTTRAAIVTMCAIVAMGLATVPAHAATPGQLDKFFSGDGKQTTFSRGGTGYAVAIDGNDRIVVAGYTLSGQTDLAVARFLPNGTPDTSFGGDGRITTDLGGTDYGFDIAIHPDGGIVVVGERDTASGSKAAVVRYLPRGKRNKDFGGGDGIVLTSFGKKYQGANAVVIGASGNITIGGFTSNGSTAKWALARYGPRGVLDKSFGGDGKVTVDLSPADERINDMVIAEGGRVVAAGYAEAGITPRFAVAKFQLNGALDKDFGHKGANMVDVSKGADIALGLGQGADGSLVAVGHAANGGRDDWGLAAFGPNGRLNDHFGGDGIRLLELGPQYEFASGTAVQPNGRVVVVGRASRKNSGDDFGVFRLKPNGAYDNNFSNDGRAYVNFFGGSDTARSVVLQANGKIVVAGEATDHGKRRMAVARLVGR
jgi:uncharacterized delta-60 repeat protein